MRFFLLPIVIAAGVLITSSACTNSHKIVKKIDAFVVADTLRRAEPLPMPVPQPDSIQIEFANKLSVPYDSIRDLKLYGFIKKNLGMKCLGSQNPNYNCESFLAILFKNVYAIDFPATVAQQLKYKHFELFKDTSYLKSGDVLFFNASDKKGNNTYHSGFYLHNGFFLVGTYKSGIIITRLNNNYWSKHFKAAGRINKLYVKT